LGSGTCRSLGDLVACDLLRRRLGISAGRADGFKPRERGRVLVPIPLTRNEVALEALAEAGEESQTL
jgi:hypothetical protein